MDYLYIINKTLDVMIDCNIRSFPFDCLKILEHYNYTVRTYEEIKKQNPILYDICYNYSEDAFRDNNNKLISYNPDKPPGRIRFSLMHELGHEILRHSGESKGNEAQANFFASNILAPRMAIHYANCNNAPEVSKIFDLSYEAADIAFNDYRRWYRYIVSHGNIITPNDKSLYNHFYDKGLQKFIYSRKKCRCCGKELLNSVDDTCNMCNQTIWGRSEPRDWVYDSALAKMTASNWWEPPGFESAERDWLYGVDL